MSTTYFLCGGPYQSEANGEDLLPGFERTLRQDAFWTDAEGPSELVCVVVDDIWVIGGDSDRVFELGPSICRQLSKHGKAGEFYAQTTAGYYEIVFCENGKEVQRLYRAPDPPVGRKNVTLAKSERDDLWEYSQKILPVPWNEVYDREGMWWKLKEKE